MKRLRGTNPVRKLLGLIAASAVVAGSLVMVGGTVTAAPAQAAAPLLCDGSGIYTLNTNGGAREFNVISNVFTPTSGLSITGQQNNGLGVSGDGRYVYAVANGDPSGATKQLSIHDRLTEQTQTRNLGDPNVPSSLIRGAVNPVDGLYYYGGSGSPAYLGVYNPHTGTAYRVGSIPGIGGQNGDFAFTADGQLILVADRNVYAVQGEIPSVPGNATLNLGGPIATLPDGANGNGIAFGNYGNIYVSTSTTLYEIDLISGQIVAQFANPGGGNFTDLTSCAYPNTVKLQKDIQPDRFAPADQFLLAVDAPDRAGRPRLGQAQTTGAEPGLQPVAAGAYVSANGENLNLSEAAAGTTNLGYYTSSIQCIDAASNDAPVAVRGAGPAWSVTQPDNLRGSSLVCTATNTALKRSLELSKTSDPASGTAVDVGDEIAYTVTASNTGEVAMDFLVSDDLSDVLNHAAVTEAGFTATIVDANGHAAPAPQQPVLDGPTAQLTWGGNLGVGEAVTISYTVTVSAAAAGETLHNAANATATPPGGGTPPPSPPEVTTTHEVNAPGFELTKAVDPGSGTAVNPGDTLEYTITAANTGATPLTGVEVTDDLAALLENGTVDEDSITALINGEAADPAASYADGVLSWTGDLAVGETLTVAFEFTVGANAGGATLRNSVEGEATPPGGGTITPPQPVVTNPVNEPGFELTKTANPPSGEGLNPGTPITYTVVGSNTGQTPLDPVTVTDDLSGVLEHASLVSGPVATIGGATVEGLTFEDEVARWNGALAVGEDLVITYTVQIDDDARGATLTNSANGSATPPGGGEPIEPEAPPTTEHTVNDPRIQLEKTGALQAAGENVAVGDTIAYGFTATNTGNVTLTGVSIADPLPGLTALVYDWSDASGEGTLAPGESVTATGTLALTQEHIDSGLVHNTAVAEGTPPPVYNPEDPGNPAPQQPVTDESAAVTPLAPAASIELVKTGRLSAAGESPVAGDTIGYTLVATNTGNVTLHDVSIADGLPGIEDLTYDWSEADAPGVLAPGQAVTLTGVYALTQQDVDAGAVVNVGETTGTPPNIKDVEDPEGPGEPATPVTDEDPETVPVERSPRIDLVKQIQEGQEFSAAGDTVVYEFIVTNTGTTSLSKIGITDDLLGPDAEYSYHWDESDAAVAGTLAPGDSVRVTADYILTQGDVDHGWVENTAVAEGTPPPAVDPDDPDGPPVEQPPVDDSSRVVTPIAAAPSMTLEKTGRLAGAAEIGGTVKYSFVATNTGNVTLTGVSIDDPLPGLGELVYDWPGDAGVLAPRESVTATASYTLTRADIDRGYAENTAIATGTPPETYNPEDPESPIQPPNPQDDDRAVTPLDPHPSIEVVKDGAIAGEAAVGGSVEYTFTVTNTGNVTLSNVSLSDELPGISGIVFGD